MALLSRLLTGQPITPRMATTVPNRSLMPIIWFGRVFSVANNCWWLAPIPVCCLTAILGHCEMIEKHKVIRHASKTYVFSFKSMPFLTIELPEYWWGSVKTISIAAVI